VLVGRGEVAPRGWAFLERVAQAATLACSGRQEEGVNPPQVQTQSQSGAGVLVPGVGWA
jgi:hypothetical protein